MYNNFICLSHHALVTMSMTNTWLETITGHVLPVIFQTLPMVNSLLDTCYNALLATNIGGCTTALHYRPLVEVNWISAMSCHADNGPPPKSVPRTVFGNVSCRFRTPRTVIDRMVVAESCPPRPISVPLSRFPSCTT